MKSNYYNSHFKIPKTGIKTLLFVCLMIAFSSRDVKAAYTVTLGANPNWCTSSYPTSYSTVSFSIAESGTVSTRRGFNPNQTNRTMTFGFSNANFQFNAGVGAVTASGTEVTINSYSITSTAITVNITTSATNVQLNTLNFNGLQVRATAAANGYICRTGGTFTIDRSTNRPTGTTALTNLTATSPLTFSSATTTQSSSANVAPSAINQQIVRVAVTLAGGTCATVNASSFVFTTAGSSNPTNDIQSASLYYTGTSTTFSTGSLFGTANNPNGTFTINGSQTLTAATTYYFWLTYDIKNNPTNGNVLDAQATGATLNGTTYNFTGNPAGSRTIITTTYYSIAAGNWSTTGNWSLVSNTGASCGCTPAAGALVQVAHAIVLNTTTTMTNVTVVNGGSLTSTGNSLTVTGLLSTSGNGSFSAGNSWSVQDLTLTGTGSSTFSVNSALTITGSIDIGNGTTLNRTNSSLTVNGTVNVDGVLNLNGNAGTFNGFGADIDGLGTINGTGTLTLASDKTILAGANITINPTLALNTNTTVTNYGFVTQNRNLTGSSTSTSIWINEINSTLQLTGNFFMLTNGFLNATAAGNTVIYGGPTAGSQNVKSTSYYNITFLNGTKTLLGNINVANDLTLSGNAVLDASNGNDYSIAISGNWINNSTATNPFLYRLGTVNFNGITAIQGSATSAFNSISVSAGSTLTAHPTTGKFQVAGDFNNDGDFLHNNSDITFLPNNASVGGANSSVITQSSTIDFNSVIINSSKTITLPSSQITISGNLTNNGTINHGSGLVSFTGSGTTQTFGGTTTSNNLYDFEVDNFGGTIVLSNPLTVNDTLFLTNGVITTPSSSLTIASSGISVSQSASSYVSGTMKRVFASYGSKVFAVGKGGNYRPLTFTYTSLTGTSTVTVEQFETALTGTIPSPSVLNNSRYWDISQTGGSSFAYTVQLDGTGDVISGPVVILRKQSGTITSVTATTPNYTNSVDFSTLTGTCSFTTGSNCSVTSNAGTSQTGSATCGLTSVTLNATSPSSGTGTWSVDAGTGGSFGNTTSNVSSFTGTAGTTYTLQWTVTDGNCSAGSQVTVSLGRTSPAITAATSSATVCYGNSINLTASPASTTLLSANFNSGTNGFTNTNSSTGGATSTAAWTLTPNGTFLNALTFNSNDNSQFYLTDSRSQNGTTTVTSLVSPGFSTVGFSSLSLSFYHYFRYQGGLTAESANVQYSTDGITWTTLPGGSYTSSQGNSNAFVNATFDLSPYVGNNVFYIRFFYNVAGGRARYWAIDNVSITGTQSLNYAWSSTPTGFTSSVQNPTSVAPTVNTSYTVVGTNSNSCSNTSNTVAVSVTSVTPTITISNTATSLCSGIAYSSSITNGGSTPTYQWKRNGNPISGANTSTYTGVGLANNDAITCELTSNAACATSAIVSSNSLNFGMSGVPTTTWNGSVSTNWATAGNWSAGVPTSNVSAVIASGTPNSPSISSTANVYNLTVNSGATLNITGTTSLNVYGNITNDGTLVPFTSSISLVGCAGTTGYNHSLASSNNTTVMAFANLTLNDAAGATLNTNATITDALNLSNGTFTNNNKTFTFISNALKTAYIAPVTSGTYSGNITMQRYVPGGASGWKIIGSPVTNSTLADWYNNNTELFMSGFPGVSYATGPTGNFVSVYTYNESIADIADSGYTAPTDVTNSLINGKGYVVYMASSMTGLNATTFDVTGTPKMGNATLPVTYTNTGSSSDDGWNIVSNPYPSAINWGAAGWTKTNVNNYFYIYSADINNYATFTASPADSTNGGSRFIPSSQGFIVKASGSSPVLSCTENVKSNNQGAIKSQSGSSVGLRLKIEKAGSSLLDEAIVRFDMNALDGYDELDAEKFYPTGAAVNIVSIADNKELTYNFLSTFSNQIQIPVKVKVPGNGLYTITVSNLTSLINEYPFYFAGNNMVLEDLTTGVVTNLDNPSNSYQMMVLNGTTSRNFVIRFADNSLVTSVDANALFETVNVYNKNNEYFVSVDVPATTTVVVDLYSLNGQLVKPSIVTSSNKSIIKLNTDDLSKGIYFAKVNVGSKLVTKKIYIE